MNNDSVPQNAPCNKRDSQPGWFYLGAQLIPLILAMGLVAACAGGGGLDGVGTSRSTDLVLSYFTNINRSNGSSVEIEVRPFQPNANQVSATNPCLGLVFPDVQARLVIRNGIGATIETIVVNFTEVDGSALTDLSGAVPVSREGEFDFIINTNISIPASPITSTGAASTGSEPSSVAAPTVFFVPLNVYETNIFCTFLVFQPNARPLNAQVTIRGTDVLGNAFTTTGQILVSPFIGVSASTQ